MDSVVRPGLATPSTPAAHEGRQKVCSVGSQVRWHKQGCQQGPSWAMPSAPAASWQVSHVAQQ